VPRVDDPATLTEAQRTILAIMTTVAADPELRRAVYGVQVENTARLARSLGADVIAAPPGAVTADGFLAPAFCAHGDPTHGNTAYGRLVLDQITAWCGVAA
jgi:hypothetical protein